MGEGYRSKLNRVIGMCRDLGVFSYNFCLLPLSFSLLSPFSSLPGPKREQVKEDVKAGTWCSGGLNKGARHG